MDIVNETIEMLNSTDVLLKTVEFSWYDYTLFGLMLGLSSMIGVYFGCFGKKQSSADEYLLGGKEMHVLPIALSLVASYVSGITLLAVPADIYLYGFTYGISCFSILFLSVISYFLYLPVFHKLQVTSVYEYLSLRYDQKMRVMASGFFVTGILFYLPIVIYIPALAFSQATGLNVHYITPVLCAICIFYTTIGGLKAVVWTDTLQFVAMIGGVVVVLYIGIIQTGGFENIYQTSLRGGRFDLDLDISPLKRDTLWSALFGLTTNWIGIAISQGFVQKFMALPNMKDVKWALALFCFGLIVTNFTSVLIGLIMYTTYADCDPITTKAVDRHDQLLPYYIMDVAGKIPGLPGLFIAGIVCAALSTLSAVMNSLSGTIYQDFVSRFVPKDISQKRVSNILKLIVLIIGIVCTGMVYVVEHMGGILPLAMSFGAITSGPKLGIFTLGMLVPMSNTKGTFYGCITSLATMGVIILGNQWYKYKKIVYEIAKPLNTDGCPWYNDMNTFSNSTSFEEFEEYEEPFYIFRITYYYYTLIGFIIVVLVAIPISYFTRDEDTVINPDCINPYFHRFIDKRNNKFKDYYSIGDALKVLSVNKEKEEMLNKD